MADPRNTIGSGAPPALRPITPIRSEAARAAQRAFFEAALGQTPAVIDVPATAPTAAARPASAIASLSSAFRTKPSSDARSSSDTPPSRLLRPGSIVDIKV